MPRAASTCCKQEANESVKLLDIRLQARNKTRHLEIYFSFSHETRAANLDDRARERSDGVPQLNSDVRRICKVIIANKGY